MRKILCLMVMLALVCGISNALEYQKQGVIEFGGRVSMISGDGYDSTVIAPSVDIFKTDKLSIGGSFVYTKTDFGLFDTDSTAILLAPKYFLDYKKEDVHPYVGLLYNIEEDNNAFGISAGLKRKIMSNALFTADFNYLAGDAKQTSFLFGFSLYTQKNKK